MMVLEINLKIVFLFDLSFKSESFGLTNPQNLKLPNVVTTTNK